MSHYIGPLSFYLFGIVFLMIPVVLILLFKRKGICHNRLYKIIDLMKYGVVCLFMVSASLILTNLSKEKQWEKQKKHLLVLETGKTIAYKK